MVKKKSLMQTNKTMRKHFNKLIAVLFLFTVLSCVKDTQKPVDIDDNILKLIINGNENKDSIINIVADGTTKVDIKATLGELSDDGHDITFNTSNGELLSYESTASSNNVTLKAVNKEARLQLKSGVKPENSAFITAKVKDYVIKRIINFIPAYVDTFFIQPSSYFTSGNEITVTVQLYRTNALVSNDVPIYFDAVYTGTNNLQTSISPYIFTDNNAKKTPATIQATLQKANDSTGTVQLKVKTFNRKGVLVEKSVNLNFN